MQPSVDSSGSGAPGGGALRRWGPIAAIVVVIAVIAAIVVISGGDDDDDDVTQQTSDGGDTGGDDGGEKTISPEGAVSWSMAAAEGKTDDYEWLDSCDRETGLVAMPNQFAAECY